MKCNSMVPIALLAAAAGVWVACSATPLGLHDPTPTGETPGGDAPPPEIPGSPPTESPGSPSPGVGSVLLSPESLTVAVYNTARLTVVVRDTTGAVIANPHVVFLVQGLMEGTVDSTGLVTGLPGGCGDGTVIARSQGVSSNTVAIAIGSPSGAGCWDY